MDLGHMGYIWKLHLSIYSTIHPQNAYPIVLTFFSKNAPLDLYFPTTGNGYFTSIAILYIQRNRALKDKTFDVLHKGIW